MNESVPELVERIEHQSTTTSSSIFNPTSSLPYTKDPSSAQLPIDGCSSTGQPHLLPHLNDDLYHYFADTPYSNVQYFQQPPILNQQQTTLPLYNDTAATSKYSDEVIYQDSMREPSSCIDPSKSTSWVDALDVYIPIDELSLYENGKSFPSNNLISQPSVPPRSVDDPEFCNDLTCHSKPYPRHYSDMETINADQIYLTETTSPFTPSSVSFNTNSHCHPLAIPSTATSPGLEDENMGDFSDSDTATSNQSWMMPLCTQYAGTSFWSDIIHIPMVSNPSQRLSSHYSHSYPLSSSSDGFHPMPPISPGLAYSSQMNTHVSHPADIATNAAASAAAAASSFSVKPPSRSRSSVTIHNKRKFKQPSGARRSVSSNTLLTSFIDSVKGNDSTAEQPASQVSGPFPHPSSLSNLSLVSGSNPSKYPKRRESEPYSLKKGGLSSFAPSSSTPLYLSKSKSVSGSSPLKQISDDQDNAGDSNLANCVWPHTRSPDTHFLSDSVFLDSTFDDDFGTGLLHPTLLNDELVHSNFSIPKDEAIPSLPTRKNRNVDKACNHCKRSHLRCDNMRPCRRCIATGKSGCKDVEHKPRGRPRLHKF
ncbi:hypothetical protein DM01DRAFT_1372598 [Hesseltinella vesiculosa]|uniref:Zn(2)-C6 fungal-type domain-containing protein n=1 Tax=Hesseltinella vesiculosa TaxID=101127 RepID=A0A1X2GMW8_9FUNG|nr:hypothetical protein DM01DRAFT_1372598 [Hesseltinella vesiculosa]